MQSAVGCFGGIGRLLAGRASQEGTIGHGSELPLESAEELLKLLPDGVSEGQRLREFWDTFTAINLRQLLEHTNWQGKDLNRLEQARSRCLLATYPFKLAQQLLEEGWYSRSVEEKWNVHLAVQRVIGRLEAPAPSYTELSREMNERRERYLEWTRSFGLIAGLMVAAANQPKARRPASTKEQYEHMVTSLLAAQHVAKHVTSCPHWRQA